MTDLEVVALGNVISAATKAERYEYKMRLFIKTLKIGSNILVSGLDVCFWLFRSEVRRCNRFSALCVVFLKFKTAEVFQVLDL